MGEYYIVCLCIHHHVTMIVSSSFRMELSVFIEKQSTAEFVILKEILDFTKIFTCVCYMEIVVSYCPTLKLQLFERVLGAFPFVKRKVNMHLRKFIVEYIHFSGQPRSRGAPANCIANLSFTFYFYT